MTIKIQDVLAGPIVRRVEGTKASIWIAVSKPCEVTLKLWATRAGATGTGNPEAQSHAFPLLKMGANLYIGVVSASLANEATGKRCYYDLEFQELASEPTGGPPQRVGETQNLAQLGFLQDLTPAEARAEAEAQQPHPGRSAATTPTARLALGYIEGQLPSFLFAPAQASSLRIVHGSCRKPHSEGRDALPGVDDILAPLASALQSPGSRPHMLCMTGDQIYADEVDPFLLRAMTRQGAWLVTGDEQQGEAMEVDFPDASGERETHVFPIDERHFPGARRQRLCKRVARFTSSAASSHTLGYGEYCANYLMAWSNTLWPDIEALRAERRNHLKNFIEGAVALYEKIEPEIVGDLSPSSEDTLSKREAMLSKLDNIWDLIYQHQGARLLPPNSRWLDQHASEDVDSGWVEKLDFDKQPAKTWQTPSLVTLLAAPWRDDAAGQPAHASSPEAMKLLAQHITPSYHAGCKYLGLRTISFGDRDNLSKNMKLFGDKATQGLDRIEESFNNLPKVRRALANIATYMIFDDHEITDDWNISFRWVREIRKSRFATSILRNGLASYTIFQAWGNDPSAFLKELEDDETPENDGLLSMVQNLSQQLETNHTTLDESAREAIATLEEKLNLRVTPSEKPVRWHYRVNTPGVEILGLDPRTVRDFDFGGSGIDIQDMRDAPAGLISKSSLPEQIPERAEYLQASSPTFSEDSLGISIVLSPSPVMGYPLVEEFAQPAINFIQDVLGDDWAVPTSIEEDESAHRFTRDPEPWSYVPEALEALFARLATRPHVVALSGDVHYSFSSALTYWSWPGTEFDHSTTPVRPTTPSNVQVSRFALLTSSAFKNSIGGFLRTVLHSGLAHSLTGLLSTETERLGWHRDNSEFSPVRANEFEILPTILGLLQRDPALVPPEVLPIDAWVHKHPDWAWRRTLIKDTRPHKERFLENTNNFRDLPVFADPDNPQASELAALAAGYEWMMQSGVPRTQQADSSLAVVRFETQGGFAAIHEIYGFLPKEPDTPATSLLIHRIPLTDSAEAPRVPTIGDCEQK